MTRNGDYFYADPSCFIIITETGEIIGEQMTYTGDNPEKFSDKVYTENEYIEYYNQHGINIIEQKEMEHLH